MGSKKLISICSPHLWLIFIASAFFIRPQIVSGQTLKDEVIPLSSMMDRGFLAGLLEKAKSPMAGQALGSFEKMHMPVFNVPRLIEGGALVPVRIEVPHPMEPDHYIRKLMLIDENSIVKLKFVANFTARNNKAYVSTNLKLAKSTELKAIAECNRHGSWLSVSLPIRVGQGGCSVAGAPPGRKLWGDVLWVKFAKDQAGAVRVNLTVRHPMSSGRTIDSAGKITQIHPEFYVKRIRVFYEKVLATEFDLGPGLSDNPTLEFSLNAEGGRTLRLEATNNEGEVFESLVLVRPF